MRTIRILVCLVGVLAVGLVTAASALATTIQYDASEYNPAVEQKAHAINVQGFNGGGVLIACDPAKSPISFNTNEEIGVLGIGKDAVNTKANSATLITHPVYSGPAANEKCRGTISAASFPVEVRTNGCNFKTTAVKAGPLPSGGKIKIECATVAEPAATTEVTAASAKVKVASTKGVFPGELVTTTGACTITAGTEVSAVNSATEFEMTLPAGGVGSCKEALTLKVQGIENVFLGLTGCIVTVFPQELTNLAFENKPKTGNSTEAEVTTKAEVAEIKSKATNACGLIIKEAEFKAEYRKGKIGPGESAEIEPPGNPAETVSRAKRETKNRVVTEGEVEEKSAKVKLASTAGILVGYEAASPGRARIAQCTGVWPPGCVGGTGPITVTAVSATEVELSQVVQGSGTAKEKIPLVFQESLPESAAVAVNEPHWYSQGLGLPAQSGGKGAEGLDIVSWGTLVLKSIVIGELVCQNVFGGDVYNPQGSDFASINNAKGEAKIGELKVDAFDAYDCTNTECESATLKTKMIVSPEGLGVTVNGAKEAVFGEWEGSLLPSGTEISIGNEEPVSATQIKFHLFCPSTTGGANFETSAKGRLHPAIENGSSKGSAPAVLTFTEGVAGSGLLEVGTTKDGAVKGKVKLMGFETGEFLSNKSP